VPHMTNYPSIYSLAWVGIREKGVDIQLADAWGVYMKRNNKKPKERKRETSGKVVRMAIGAWVDVR